MKNVRLIMSIEEAQRDRDKWLAIRNTGLGGSDAGIVMGLNPFKSRLTLWMEKTGQIKEPDLSDNESVEMGTEFEPVIARLFEKRTGKKVRKCGTLQSTEHPWLLANVDRLIVGEEAGLEIKNVGVRQSGLWVDDELPDMYFAQVQHYMLVTGLPVWYIAASIGGNHFIHKPVPRNEPFIEELFRKEAAFWSLVENRVMPQVDGTPDTEVALQMLYPKAQPESALEVESTEELERIFEDYKSYKESIETLEQYVAECENKIKALMGENARCKIGESHKASWINIPGRITIDAKRLQAEHPEIYKEYKKVGKASRRFSMK